MKFYFIVLIFISFSFQVFCQHHPCGTAAQDQNVNIDFRRNHELQKSFSEIGILNEVPVQIHLIGANNGLFALNTQAALNELETLNGYFADINIVFKMCNDINYINDNDLVTFIKHDSEWICDQEDVPNALNIYFAPQLEKNDGESICGYASDFEFNPRIFVDNKCADGATLAHEFGHSFSLVHTHRSLDGAELASGSNCATAGDFFCDTPADPTLSFSTVSTNCEYIGTLLDNEENPYNPDIGNVMSYSRAECVNNFSQEQLTQMRAYFDLKGAFLNCLDATTSFGAPKLSSLKAYPNPINSTLFIENIPKNTSIQIWNSNGQLLVNYHIHENTELTEVGEFSDFSNGVYYLKIVNANASLTKKIMKIEN